MSPAPLPRPPQDISLEEFDDEDLSEITDDCGIGLNYDSDHYEKVQELSVPNPPGDAVRWLHGAVLGTGGPSAWQSPSWSGGCRALCARAPRGCTVVCRWGSEPRDPPPAWPGTPGPPTTSG